MSDLTLAAGLDRYYAQNPTFLRNQDLWVGWIRIPWIDLQKHDIMHVVTGYGTHLTDEMRLIGFLLTAVTWRRPWYFYVQSLGVFLEFLVKAQVRQRFGDRPISPGEIWQHYWAGVRQGSRLRKKIDAYLDPETVMARSLADLRQEYGIANAGAWDASRSPLPPPSLCT
ncbi:MAG: hypothetical protein IGR92_06150 [Leptolyngbyaceae cyanobacterium T60_A2020_046]|nr:hypothetical protein [Leptolyngbyaceae cyanobacterium T60_A2020_046]